jgi:hypothetical protein
MIKDINGTPIDQALKEDGYVIVGDLIPQDMFPKLVDACDRSVKKARDGDWKYR